jgi:hypothetical protein
MKASPAIGGSLYKATPDGFKRLIAEANRVSRDGYELIAVVPLRDGGAEFMGCVFKRVGTESGPPDVQNDSFFE